MSRSGLWIASTVVGALISLWLYRENRALQAELDARAEQQVVASKPAEPAATVQAAQAPERRFRPISLPALPTSSHEQSKLDKRAAKQEKMAAMFGRADGESDDDYRQRVMPMVSAFLIIPRKRVADMRKLAEQKARVTEIQDQRLDAAFQQVYSNVSAYANKAIADGSVSPYERNIASWLQFGGGLGNILEDANAQIANILTPDQMRTMYDAGFEWGEYLGLQMPWEQLAPPPPRR